MAQSKIDLLSNTRMLVLSMDTILEEAGVKNGYLHFDKEECTVLPMPMVREGHKWIKELYGTAFKQVWDVKNLLAPEIWERYKLFGDDFKDHQEVILLREALIMLRKQVISRKRPDFFKRSKRNVQIKRKSKRSQPTRGKDS